MVSWRIQQEAASGMVRMRIHEIAKDRLSGLGQPWGRRDPKVLGERLGDWPGIGKKGFFDGCNSESGRFRPVGS